MKTEIRATLLASCLAASATHAQSLSLDVFDVGIPSVSGGNWASSGYATFDDVTFGGPGSRGSILLTEVGLGIIVPARASVGQQIYARMSIYPDFVVTTPPTWPGIGTPIVTALALGDLSDAAGFHIERTFSFPSPILLDRTNVFDSDTDRTVGIAIELFLDAALTQPANDWQIIRRANMPSANGRFSFPVGSSTVQAWILAPVPPSPAFNRAIYLTLTATYTCSTADFNGDGESGNEADIESFFHCLAGSCCQTCFPLGADFNADGDAGTDADIESFFRVLTGNPC